MESPPIPPLSPLDAELALERASADADWLASLRAAYQGRHDVLDALWWVAHPLTPTPGGLADPADGLRDLQSAVFSRAAAQPPVVEDTGPDGDGVLRMREAEHRLRERQRLLSEDARFLGQAWLSVHRPANNPVEDTAHDVEAPSHVEVSSHPHRTHAPSPETADTTRLDQTDPSEPSAAPRVKLLVPALVGVGLLAAIFGLPTLIDAGATSKPTPAATTPTTTPHVRMEIFTFISDGNVSDPQAVLARPQVEADQPRFEQGEPFDPGSFRRLPDLVGFLELYLARGEQADSICLVAIRGDVGHGSCVSPATFAQHGIELGSSGDRYEIGVDMTILSESFTLLANGDFHYEARARVPERTPGEGVAPEAGEHFLGS